MPGMLKLFLLAVPFFVSCHNSRPLIPKDMSNENERNNTLFVFVGEKIEVKDISYEKGDFDLGVIAKYKVLQRVYGNYDKDTISFEAYDHYGEPAFTKYKNVLMFVSESKENKGHYYMEKYQYFDVYKTKNGRWASSYKASDYGHSYNEHTTVKPEKIDFLRTLEYPVKITVAGRPVELHYPQPYYEIKGDSAIALYGNYIEELFKLKRDGFLTARQLFGNHDPTNEEIQVISPKEPKH